MQFRCNAVRSFWRCYLVNLSEFDDLWKLRGLCCLASLIALLLSTAFRKYLFMDVSGFLELRVEVLFLRVPLSQLCYKTMEIFFIVGFFFVVWTKYQVSVLLILDGMSISMRCLLAILLFSILSSVGLCLSTALKTKKGNSRFQLDSPT